MWLEFQVNAMKAKNVKLRYTFLLKLNSRLQIRTLLCMLKNICKCGTVNRT